MKQRVTITSPAGHGARTQRHSTVLLQLGEAICQLQGVVQQQTYIKLGSNSMLQVTGLVYLASSLPVFILIINFLTSLPLQTASQAYIWTSEPPFLPIIYQ